MTVPVTAPESTPLPVLPGRYRAWRLVIVALLGFASACRWR